MTITISGVGCRLVANAEVDNDGTVIPSLVTSIVIEGTYLESEIRRMIAEGYSGHGAPTKASLDKAFAHWLTLGGVLTTGNYRQTHNPRYLLGYYSTGSLGGDITLTPYKSVNGDSFPQDYLRALALCGEGGFDVGFYLKYGNFMNLPHDIKLTDVTLTPVPRKALNDHN